MATPEPRAGWSRAIPRPSELSPIEIIAATLAIAALLYADSMVSDAVDLPLFMAPLAASLAILFTAPGMTITRSWNVIGGQALSALVAVGVMWALGTGHDGLIAAPIALGLALVAMRLASCVHPPACATVMVIIFAPVAPDLAFVLFPVLTGSAFVVLLAWVVHVLEARVPPRLGGRTTPGHGQPRS